MHTRESLIREIKKYASRTKGPITVTGFCRNRRMSVTPLYRCFAKGYPDLLRAAGLAARSARAPRYKREELMSDLHRVATDLGKFPSRNQLTRLGRHSLSAYRCTFGSWDTVQDCYQRFKSQRRPIAPATIQPRTHAPSKRPHHQLRGTRAHHQIVGAPISLPGLLHAPTSESGVVHLFGLLGRELGIVVEHISASFPDCRALRIDDKGTWRRIAIEFEFRSSNFRVHRHDPSQCDLIVCWEHDWPECPVEVMELKGVVESTAG